jgi:bacillithiol biosynthesis cysteine-adding enzyme BshC
MDCSCIRQTELPGTSRLFADFTYHPDRVSEFYPWATCGGEAFAEAARQIQDPAQYPGARRSALIASLREQNGDSPLLDRLSRPGTVAVVTGQQVGFLSGPAYTIYKALTAVVLAERLTARGIDAVPVFWLATEDHDFAEVNHVWVYNQDHQPARLDAVASPEANQPVGGIPLGSFDWNQLKSALGTLPFADDVLRLGADAYTPGTTLGQAFRSLVSAILGEHRLLYVDPLADSIRALAAPLLRDAVIAEPQLNQKLLDRNKELIAAGYHAQVHVEAQTSLVFLLENGRRQNLRRQNGHYIAAGSIVQASDIAARPEHLSPNALLRPVVQDYILPTVAYVGGPAELAYLAQSQVIYGELLGRQPVALHRTGFTVLDSRSRKLMERYALCLPDFFHGEEALRERIAAKLVPPSLQQLLAETQSTAAGAIGRLSEELERFDPTLAKAAARSRRKMEHQVSKIAGKVARQILQRDQTTAQHAASLNGLLYPHKHLQERLYSILPLLAEHGPDLASRIYEHVQLDCPDHQLVTV